MTNHDLRAWGDESVRLALAEPAYLLAAAVVAAEHRDECRAVLRSQLTFGRKLHWRELDSRARHRAIESVASFDLVTAVVIGVPVVRAKQERARARCLERLAWELHERAVATLSLEARPSSLMTRDLKTIDSLRGTNALPRGLRIEHELPSEEPLLWIPDLVLGAVGESLSGELGYLATIEHITSIVSIEL